MSSPVYMMTNGFCFELTIAARTASAGRSADIHGRMKSTVPLTVPLLCSGGGFEGEGLHEVECGVAQRQAAHGGPQVDDVALGGAAGVEALEDVIAEVDAEGAAAAVAAMDG